MTRKEIKNKKINERSEQRTNEKKKHSLLLLFEIVASTCVQCSFSVAKQYSIERQHFVILHVEPVMFNGWQIQLRMKEIEVNNPVCVRAYIP